MFTSSGRSSLGRRAAAGLGCLLWIALSPANAADVVDQRQDNFDSDSPPFTYAIGGVNQQEIGQVISAGMDGSLVAVNLPVACGEGSVLTVEVREFLTGATLSTVDVPGSSLPPFSPGGESFRRIEFPSPAFFAAGDTFALVLKASSPVGCSVVRGPLGNNYPRGSAYLRSEEPYSDNWAPTWPTELRDDIPFQTVVKKKKLAKVDQEQPDVDWTVGGLAIGGQSEQRLAQTVTARRSGLLSFVRLPIGCGDPADEVEVSIQGVGSDGLPNGSTLTSKTVPGSALPPPAPGFPAFRTVRLPSPVAVSSGFRFAIVLTPAGLPACGILQGPVGDPYLRGTGFYAGTDPTFGDSGWIPLAPGVPRADLPFQTIVD
jgi:hypothetical protein